MIKPNLSIVASPQYYGTCFGCHVDWFIDWDCLIEYTKAFK